MIVAADSFGLPPASAWVFFVLHLLAAATHLTSLVLLMTPVSRRIGLTKLTRSVGIVEHLGGGALHILLGLNSFFGWSLRNPDGTVPWQSMTVVIMIAFGMPAYLYLARRDLNVPPVPVR